MTLGCDCAIPHEPRHIVITGGPGSGKTAILELVRQSFCDHVRVLPESAGILFGGGFPRSERPEIRRPGQRAIFYIQRELEAAADADHPALVLCDRGTVDGGAYWPGPDDFWTSVGTTLAEQLGRYDVVIHLRPPTASLGYDQRNPLRIEAPGDAARIDACIERLWAAHPRRFVVEPAAAFMAKASRALEIVRGELPDCCRAAVVA